MLLETLTSPLALLCATCRMGPYVWGCTVAQWLALVSRTSETGVWDSSHHYGSVCGVFMFSMISWGFLPQSTSLLLVPRLVSIASRTGSGAPQSWIGQVGGENGWISITCWFVLINKLMMQYNISVLFYWILFIYFSNFDQDWLHFRWNACRDPDSSTNKGFTNVLFPLCAKCWRAFSGSALVEGFRFVGCCSACVRPPSHHHQLVSPLSTLAECSPCFTFFRLLENVTVCIALWAVQMHPFYANGPAFNANIQ